MKGGHLRRGNHTPWKLPVGICVNITLCSHIGSCDVYDPPPGQLALKLPQGTMSRALTRNMLENQLCVTQDTDTVGGTDRNRSRGKVFGQT